MSLLPVCESFKIYADVGITHRHLNQVTMMDDNTTSIEVHTDGVNYLSHEFFVCLSEKIKHLQNVNTLLLSGFYMTKADIDRVTEALVDHHSLTHLTIPYFDDAGKLAEYLSEDRVPIRSLQCRATGLFDRTATHKIVQSLSTNHTLTSFSIQTPTNINSILYGILDALRTNTTLEVFKHITYVFTDHSNKLLYEIQERCRNNRRRNVTLYGLLINELCEDDNTKRRRNQ